jgi:hypothetical protein
MIAFAKGDTRTLTLPSGERLIVRYELSAGQSRAHYGRLYVPNGAGLRVDPMQIGLSLITAYLVDWTVCDETGAPVPIRGLSVDELGDVLNALTAASFAEIREAIEAHEQTVLAERLEKKTDPATANAPAATSISAR